MDQAFATDLAIVSGIIAFISVTIGGAYPNMVSYFVFMFSFLLTVIGIVFAT